VLALKISAVIRISKVDRFAKTLVIQQSYHIQSLKVSVPLTALNMALVLHVVLNTNML
jgi:hypothetical protein